ncbi:hypothetical protein A2U01_0068987, partial [Trifolium medium]|nr:hypothetical protein [Trifolium medium]
LAVLRIKRTLLKLLLDTLANLSVGAPASTKFPSHSPELRSIIIGQGVADQSKINLFSFIKILSH